MSRDALIGLGMIGTTFISIGALIGGMIVNKHHKKQNDLRCDVYKGLTDILKDQLIREMTKNEDLKSKLNSKEA